MLLKCVTKDDNNIYVHYTTFLQQPTPISWCCINGRYIFGLTDCIQGFFCPRNGPILFDSCLINVSKINHEPPGLCIFLYCINNSLSCSLCFSVILDDLLFVSGTTVQNSIHKERESINSQNMLQRGDRILLEQLIKEREKRVDFKYKGAPDETCKVL